MARKKVEPDTLLGHADDNDGIEEYDNNLPNWWLGLFYFTIIVGVWMFLDWHVLNDKSLAGLYDAEVAAAEAQYGEYESAAPTEIALTPDSIAAGAALYITHCVRCHGDDGTGYIGPNLADPVWIHGGTPSEIALTIYEGVEEQAMPRWGPELGVDNVASLTAFVHSLGGGL